MSKSVTYRQDMPPPGGYKSITFKKVPQWTPKSFSVIAGLALIIPVGIWDYTRRKARCIKQMIEDDEGRQALEPLLEAETDRLTLWQLRRNRDEENELMKDVPGWVTGTWFGEPLFKTNANFDTWVQPTFLEAYAHVRERDMQRHMYLRNHIG